MSRLASKIRSLLTNPEDNLDRKAHKTQLPEGLDDISDGQATQDVQGQSDSEVGQQWIFQQQRCLVTQQALRNADLTP